MGSRMRHPLDANWCLAIHQRLLDCDPTAPAELVEVCLDALVSALRSTHKLYDTSLTEDAAADALLAYAKAPEKFNPAQRGLFGYLQMAATGDLRNAIAKERRRHRWEQAVDDVELAAAGGNRLAKL